MKMWIFGVAALAAAMCFGATTEDGVTKERRGALGPNDTVVTDVDTTGIVAARTYTKDEIDRRIATNAPVRSVNGRTGRVILGASDVGALPNNRDDLKASANFRNAVWDVQIRDGGCDTNTVDALANSAVVTNALTVATTNRVALLESSKADETVLAAHVANTNNPHAVTAEQVGAVPLVEDYEGNKTAVTIGSRNSGNPVGAYSLANGNNVTASGSYSHAEGTETTASGSYSHAEGAETTASGYLSHAAGYMAQTRNVDAYSFAWNGDRLRSDMYSSHGLGTFNINPADGLDGFYIGEQTLYAILTNKADKAAPSAAGNLAALDANGNLADSEVPATRVPTAAKQLEWDGKRDRTDLSLDTWVAGEGAPESIKGQPQWNEDPGCWTWDWHTPGGVYESFRTWDASSPDDPGPIELYDELDIMSGRYFTATRDRIAKESQLTSKADRSMISATNPTFSNAVLAVNVDFATNTTGAAYVAVTNALAGFGFDADALAELPGGKVYGSIGGLLAALAAAVAWLKKNKVQTLKLNDNSVETSADGGVAKLDNFFTESNSLLNGRLAYSRNATGLKDRAFNTLSFDGTEFNLSAALEAVTPTASGQPRDLLIVATATAATTISFTAGTIKGDKPTIDGSGTWLITLTEYAANTWYCRQIKMEDAA